MADEKTRVIRRAGASATEPQSGEPPIVFFCPSGHRLKVPQKFAGKRGTCATCGATVQIPMPEASAGEVLAAPGEEPQAFPEPVVEKQDEIAGVMAAAPPPPPPGDAVAGGDDVDWNFISGIDAPVAQQGESFSGEWNPAAMPPLADSGNPMARLLARLWAEREHGGIIEVHLVGGAVILPEEFAARWSGGTHGVFASQAADGTVTLTAVAWETVQRIVVRHLSAVPGDMFE